MHKLVSARLTRTYCFFQAGLGAHFFGLFVFTRICLDNHYFVYKAWSTSHSYFPRDGILLQIVREDTDQTHESVLAALADINNTFD